MPKTQRQMSHNSRNQPYSHFLPTESTMSTRPFPQDYTSPSAGDRGSTAWSQEDDTRLMQYRAQGMNWGPIATHFPTKTANACRKRHERLMEKKNAESWDGIKIEDLARAYLDCREQMWKVLADHVGEKWTTVESKCMEKGLKTLQTAGRAARRHSAAKQGSPYHHSQHSETEFDDSGLGFAEPSPGSSHLPPPAQAASAQQHHQSPYMPYALNPAQTQRAGSIGSASSALASIHTSALPMQQQHQPGPRFSYSSQQSLFSSAPTSSSYMASFGGNMTFSPTATTGFSSQQTLPSLSRTFDAPANTRTVPSPLPPLLPSLLASSQRHHEPITASY